MEVILKFFENTNYKGTKEGSGNENEVISRTMLKIAVVSRHFRQKHGEEKMPKHGELWRCRVVKEINSGKNKGCLDGDTLVWTAEGLLPIRRVAQVDVQSAEKVRYCNSLLPQGMKSTVRIKTRLGYDLTGTPDHRVQALDQSNQQVVWKELGSLTDQDYVLIRTSSDLPWPPSLSWEFSHEGVAKDRNYCDVEVPSCMTPELASLLGYLVSEGCQSPDRVAFYNSDYFLREDFFRCFRACFGHDPKFRESKNEVYSHLTKVRSFLSFLGFTDAKSGDKEIPWSIMEAPRECVRAFIRAFWEGDGSLVQLPSVASKSGRLITGMHQLLLRLGIVAARHENTRTTGFFGEERATPLTMHSLCVRGQDIDSFLEIIGFVSPKSQEEIEEYRNVYFSVRKDRTKRNLVPGAPTTKNPHRGAHFKHAYFVDLDESSKLKKLEGSYIFDAVVLNEDVGVREVYDISVEGEHCFVANGIVAHNCFIVEPMGKIDDQNLTHLIPGWYDSKLVNGRLIILPRRQGVNWILPLTHKRIMSEEHEAYCVIVSLDSIPIGPIPDNTPIPEPTEPDE